jgi:hypothetical protein
MSIEEAKCLVTRTASLSVALINNLLNEGVIKKVLYNIKAMAIITDRIKRFLKNRFLRKLFSAISAASYRFLGL